jgi:hypothetical protein
MKSAKFQKNIHRRGAVPESTIKKGSNYPVGPLVLGLFIFVVIGSGKEIKRKEKQYLLNAGEFDI